VQQPKECDFHTCLGRDSRVMQYMTIHQMSTTVNFLQHTICLRLLS